MCNNFFFCFKVDINERPLSIISEALGGSNVDNCPHACVARPCGPLARCIPNLESYECQCNPQNAQCNKAEEVALTSSTLTTLNTADTFTTTSKIATTDNDDDSTDDEDEENYGDDDDENEIEHIEENSGSFSDDILDSFDNQHFKIENSFSSDMKFNTETIATTTDAVAEGQLSITSTIFKQIIENSTRKPNEANGNINSDEIVEGKNNLRNERNSSNSTDNFIRNTISEANLSGKDYTQDGGDNNSKNNDDNNADDDEYYYEYDEEMDAVEVNSNQEESGHVVVNTNINQHHFALYPSTTEEDVENRDLNSNLIQTKTPIDNNHKNSNINNNNNKDENLEDVKQKLEVTRVNGRYMSVDNDQLIKYDKEVMKKKKKTQQQQQQSELYAKMYNVWRKSDDDGGGGSKNKYGKKDHGACFAGTDSYLHFSDAETMRRIISYRIDLNLRFKTHSNHGLILWTGRHTASEGDDYLSLGIENGYLHLRYNLGSGEVNIKYNGTRVSDGLWHRIRANRYDNDF